MSQRKHRGLSLVAVMGLMGVMATLVLAVVSLKGAYDTNQQSKQQLKFDSLSAVNIGSAELRSTGVVPATVQVGDHAVQLASTLSPDGSKLTISAGDGASKFQAFATKDPGAVPAQLLAQNPNAAWVVRDSNNVVISKFTEARVTVEQGKADAAAAAQLEKEQQALAAAQQQAQIKQQADQQAQQLAEQQAQQQLAAQQQQQLAQQQAQQQQAQQQAQQPAAQQAQGDKAAYLASIAAQSGNTPQAQAIAQVAAQMANLQTAMNASGGKLGPGGTAAIKNKL